MSILRLKREKYDWDITENFLGVQNEDVLGKTERLWFEEKENFEILSILIESFSFQLSDDIHSIKLYYLSMHSMCWLFRYQPHLSSFFTKTFV